MLNLQRSAGNRAVVSLLAQTEGHEQPSVPVQRWTLDGKAIKAADKYTLVPHPVPNGKGEIQELEGEREANKAKDADGRAGQEEEIASDRTCWSQHRILGVRPTSYG